MLVCLVREKKRFIEGGGGGGGRGYMVVEREGKGYLYLMFLARYLPMVFDLKKIGRT